MTVQTRIMQLTLPAMMLATGSFASVASAAPEPVACVMASRTPEAHAFYGDQAKLARLVDKENLQVNDRRLYLYTLETNKGAELVLFERDGDKLDVSRWQGASVGDLKERLNDVMMSNQGEHCIGKRSKDLIQARFELQPAGTRALPTEVSQILDSGGKAPDGSFARLTLFLLC